MCKCQRDRYKDPATENEKVINLREEVIKRLEQTVGNDQFLRNEPMKKHITFRVGGPAACFLMPSTKEQIEEIVHICQEEKTPCFILGNGSNLLVSDQGYDGAVLQIYKNMNQVAVNGEQLQVQAGALLSAIARKALDAGLTGMEFAAGIPGTLGGAVVMNAGAYGAELSQVVAQVEGIHLADGRRVSYPADRMSFSYRHSALMDTDVVVTQATLALAPGDPEAIRARMEACARARREKQPLNLPSAGSTFKRPEGHFAAKLIDDCGLRGLTVGGAQVSEKHAGFVVNVGGATARDMLELMRQIEQRVFEQTGVQLEPEVRILGADEPKKEESV